MKLLVLCQDYPTEINKYAMQFVHSRNMEYQKKGIDVTVLNFKTQEDYEYKNIAVLSEKSVVNKLKAKEFDIVIAHAPNIKNHVRFLRKYQNYLARIIPIFHGHEALRVTKYYPAPYDFLKKTNVKRIVSNIYDTFKLFILKKVLSNFLASGKLHMIFVSEWMRINFVKCVGMDESITNQNSTIIHNNSNEVFLKESYMYNEEEKLADFITIRPFDDSKYAIDLVVKFAKENPEYTFHIYGKGRYFSYNEKPGNVEIFEHFLDHDTIPGILNKYRCALMPTRLDAQGVMMCEFATYGIPMITSNLPICKEMLQGFENVFFISNEASANYENFKLNKEDCSVIRNEKFSIQNTVMKEIMLLKNGAE